MGKNFKIAAGQIKHLATGLGSCIASDKITVDGLPVRFLYRTEPQDKIDSGWKFLSGTESDAYMDNASNHEIYDVNTIANYDPSIIPLLDSPIGTVFEKPIDSTKFIAVKDWWPEDVA